MTTKQHSKIIDRLTTDFANLASERKQVERSHNCFQSAFQNPYSGAMIDLNERWDAKLTEIRAAVESAMNDGVRGTTCARWLGCVDQWNAIKEIIQWDCEGYTREMRGFAK